jgi:serine/threonine-protein kinase
MAEAAPRTRLPELAKYEVLEEIGHGGMATVYRAVDRRLGREVAVKLIHPHLRDSSEVVARFHAEAKAVAKLHHPNIVEVFDVSDTDEADQYLVVELIRGTTLRKILQAQGPMPPEVAACVGLDLLGAVAHAHASGVIHRDIKPENVLIEHHPRVADDVGGAEEAAPTSETGRRVIVKLTDFGIAKLLDAQGVTSTGQVLGSPAHMAPEQIEGGEVDGRADVFGLGVLLYECMVGHLPFEGNNPAQVLRRVLDGQYPEAQREKPTVGSRWSAILDRALAHSPKDRYADAGSMRAALLAELQRVGLSSPRPELEGWLDDPKVYGAAFRTRMIDKLCALGDEARRKGLPLEAAADWNRALAHAPEDPKLLRLVAGMQRAEARARSLRQGARVLAISACLGVTAYFVGKLVQGRPHLDMPSASTSVAAPRPTPPPSAVATASSPTGEPSHTSTRPSVAAAATQRPADHAAMDATSPAKTAADRTITLHLTPAMGVHLSIDGAGEIPVQTGQALTLSAKAHALAFTCPVCSPANAQLPAGDKDDELTVSVPILAATLVIDGPTDRNYELAERPTLSLHPGANKVDIGGQFESVTVVQLETRTRVPVRLEAGKEVHAQF